MKFEFTAHILNMKNKHSLNFILFFNQMECFQYKASEKGKLLPNSYV